MTEKHLKTFTIAQVATRVLLPAFAAVTLTSSLFAQAGKASYPTFGAPQQQLTLPPIPVTQPITPNGAVVEDVIARINDQIITRSEYEQSERGLLEEARRNNVSEADLDAQQKNLLRDMIDQQILIAKGKELGINGEAEMTRRLDEIRKQNHLDSMEALEKAAASQGVSFEDFKQSQRNNAITQQVVRDEVGRRLQPTRAQEQSFYDAHKSEFTVPEQIHLSEILIPTPEGATETQISEARAKADAVESKLKGGAAFADVAKASSGGPTASAGGDLGDFKHGALGDILENATFPLAVGAYTAPIRTRQGYVILKVDSHQAAGVPPLDQVENQVQEGVYMEALQPALRDYLTRQRTDMYVDVKPGFVDSGAISRRNKDVFTAYKAPSPKKKTVKHEQAEVAKANRVQAELTAARDKVAQRNAEKAAATQAAAASKPGAKNVSKAVKPAKVHREKIRYGQAPRNALPTSLSAATTIDNGKLTGQAPGVAMALSASTTTISTGGVPEAEASDDPLGIKAEAPTKKTRFAQRQHEQDEQRLQAELKKVEVKASVRPFASSQEATASEKQQAAPLGLNGDTTVKKKKHVKGEQKERLQEQPTTKSPVDNAPTPAPTANPALVKTPVAPPTDAQRAKQNSPSADQTTLPSTDTPPNSAPPQGQAIPATTSATPNAPATANVPH